MLGTGIFCNLRIKLQTVNLCVGVFDQVFEVILLLVGLVSKLPVGLLLLAQFVLKTKVVKEVRRKHRSHHKTGQKNKSPRRKFAAKQRW